MLNGVPFGVLFLYRSKNYIVNLIGEPLGLTFGVPFGVPFVVPFSVYFGIQNWIKTGLRPRVSLPLVSRARRDQYKTLTNLPDMGKRMRQDFLKY
jgi:hypothetical protein